MIATIQTILRTLGIFLTGAFMGILLFMIWTERSDFLVVKPSLKLAMMVGIPIAMMVVFIPGLLADVAAGVNKLKDTKSQNQPPDRTR